MPTGIPSKSAGETLSASEFNTLNNLVNTNETNITGKANTSHSHTASDVTDFDTEVANNSTVDANTTARHTHANKALLDTYTQTEVDIADAVSKKHTQGGDTALDTGNANEVTAADLRSHLDNLTKHREINDSSVSTTSLWSSDQIQSHAGVEAVILSDTDLSYSLNTHSNKLIVCGTPTATRSITIDSANVSKDDTLKIIANTSGSFVYRLTAAGSMSIKSLTDLSSISSPYALDDGLYIIHIEASTNTIWVAKFGDASGATSGSMSTFRAKKSGAQTLTTAGGWGDVTLWTQDAITDTSIFSFNTTTGELTVNATAPVLFVLDIDLDDTGNDRVEGWIGLSIDTGGGHTRATEHTAAFYGPRNTSSVDEGGRSLQIIYDATSGDKFKPQAKVEVTDSQILTERARFQAILLTGAVGPAGPAGGNEKEDNVFRIIDNSDNTKKIAFEASGITTGTTRTITMPDSDVNLGSLYDPGTYAASTSYNANASGPVDSRIDSENEVFIRGNITASAGISSNTTLCQLANAPAADFYQPVAIYDNSAGAATSFAIFVKIDTSGNVSTNSGLSANDIVYLNGIRFYGG